MGVNEQTPDFYADGDYMTSGTNFKRVRKYNRSGQKNSQRTSINSSKKSSENSSQKTPDFKNQRRGIIS